MCLGIWKEFRKTAESTFYRKQSCSIEQDTSLHVEKFTCSSLLSSYCAICCSYRKTDSQVTVIQCLWQVPLLLFQTLFQNQCILCLVFHSIASKCMKSCLFLYMSLIIVVSFSGNQLCNASFSCFCHSVKVTVIRFNRLIVCMEL